MNTNCLLDLKLKKLTASIPNFYIKRDLRKLSSEKVKSLSERWIQVSEKILDQIKRLADAKGKDRLELVSSMSFMLSALQRSLLGWMQWVNNPEIMARFTLEDLEKMNKKLSEFTRSFIEYDLEATRLGAERGLKARKAVKRKKRERPEIFYV